MISETEHDGDENFTENAYVMASVLEPNGTFQAKQISKLFEMNYHHVYLFDTLVCYILSSEIQKNNCKS